MPACTILSLILFRVRGVGCDYDSDSGDGDDHYDDAGDDDCCYHDHYRDHDGTPSF